MQFRTALFWGGAPVRLIIVICLSLVADYVCPLADAQREDPRVRAARLAKEHCVTPFGTVLGWANGVPAFSNCNEHHVSNLSSHIDTETEQPLDEKASSTTATATVEIGMKWQCVEYARRFWWTRRGVAFRAVDTAEEIWALKAVAPRDHFDLAEEAAPSGVWGIPVRRLSNTAASHPPHPEDLLVWSRQLGMPHGHVAVVVAMRPISSAEPAGDTAAFADGAIVAEIEIAEQNYHNQLWGTRNCSRVLSLVKRLRPDGIFASARAVPTYQIMDPDGAKLLGWLRLGSPNDQHELSDDEL